MKRMFFKFNKIGIIIRNYNHQNHQTFIYIKTKRNSVQNRSSSSNLDIKYYKEKFQIQNHGHRYFTYFGKSQTFFNICVSYNLTRHCEFCALKFRK